MEKTVAELKVGSKLILGSYAARANAQCSQIVWLKADLAGHYIAEDCIDMLAFDAGEVEETIITAYGTNHRMLANNDYRLSNIHQYLNSQQANWFTPTHEKDEPPELYSRHIFTRHTEYKNHTGFLHDFETYELDAMREMSYNYRGVGMSSLVRLPTEDEIKNQTTKFPLFRRKGIRAHPSVDLCSKGGLGLYPENFLQFWTMDTTDGSYVKFISSSCATYTSDPRAAMGIRPVIMLKPETKVRLVGKHTYEIIPADSKDEPSQEALLSFLGLTLP